MRSILFQGVTLLLIVVFSGCEGEDKLAGTPQNLPPGTMPPAPPLVQTPRDMAKSLRTGRSKASARHSQLAPPRKL